MPKIRPISDLRNNSSEIAEFCKSIHEPVFIELYSKLSGTEENIANGDQGMEFSEFANQLWSKVHGAI